MASKSSSNNNNNSKNNNNNNNNNNLNNTNTAGSSSTAPPYEVQYPEYRDVESRVKSFVGWPGQVVGQNPRKMAVCGLFYIGSADRVRCFSCGTTLRNWRSENDPRDVHLSFAPECTFMQALTKTTGSRAANTPSDGGSGKTSSLPPPSTGSVGSGSGGDVETTSGQGTESLDVDAPDEGGVSSGREGSTPSIPPVELSSPSSPSSSVAAVSSGRTTFQQEGGGAEAITSPDLELSSPAVQAVLEMGVARQTVEAVLREQRSRGALATPISAVELYSACLHASF